MSTNSGMSSSTAVAIAPGSASSSTNNHIKKPTAHPKKNETTATSSLSNNTSESGDLKLAEYCSKFRGIGVEPTVVPKKRMKTAAETLAARKAKKTKAPARPGLEIVNGQMVIRPLEIGGGFDDDEEDDREEVDEDSGTTSTYSSFTNRTRTERWGIEETRRFYSALQQCGTDFTLMLTQFPGRTQKQLKNKFRKENKSHPDLIGLALNPKSAIPLNVDPYNIAFGSDVVLATTTPRTAENPASLRDQDDDEMTEEDLLSRIATVDTVFDSTQDAEADLVCL